MNLDDVRKGLKMRESFRCALQGGGWEYVRPISLFRFEHSVEGKNFGGVASLYINAIDSECWTNDGWELLIPGTNTPKPFPCGREVVVLDTQRTGIIWDIVGKYFKVHLQGTENVGMYLANEVAISVH